MLRLERFNDIYAEERQDPEAQRRTTVEERGNA
jgi:hypothetical protein